MTTHDALLRRLKEAKFQCIDGNMEETAADFDDAIFAITQLQRDNAALMEDAAAQMQIAREAAIRADAWRDFATHQTWCADCAESVASCPIGIRLQTIALEKERP